MENVLKNTIGNYETSAVDKTDSERRVKAARYSHTEFAQQFVGNPKEFAEASDKAEQEYKGAMARVLIALWDNAELTEEQQTLATNLGDAIKALNADPKAKTAVTKMRERLDRGLKVPSNTGLRGEDGKKIEFITGAYRSMKSTLLTALKRGETQLVGMTKAELAEGKEAVRARSVINADRLNADFAKLVAQADANGFIFNAETGRFEAK